MLGGRDFSSLAAELIRAIKAGELEAAARLAEEARQRAALADYEDRSKAVAQDARAMVQLKRQREEVRQAIDGLPADVRLDAEHRVVPIIWKTFDQEIARLRCRKRRNSSARATGEP